MELQKLINCNNSWTQVSLFISKACYDAKHALWQKLTTQLRKASRLKLNRLKCRSQFAKNHGSTLHQSLRRTLKAKQQELLILHDKLTQHHSMTRESMVETCNKIKYWVDVGVPGGENPTRHTHRSHTHGCDLAILTHSNLKIRNLRVQKKEKVFSMSI